MRCSKCASDNREGRKFCAQCGTALARQVPAMRRCERARRKILRRMRRGARGTRAPPRQRNRGDHQIRVAEPPALRKSRGRAQDGHRAVRRHQGLDRAGAGPRSGGGARDRRSGAQADDRRGASLRRLRRAIDRRRHLRAVRRAGRARGPSAARAVRGAADAGGDAPIFERRCAPTAAIRCKARVGVNTGEVVVRSIQTGGGQTEYTPIGHTDQSGVADAGAGADRLDRGQRSTRASWSKDTSRSSRWARPRSKASASRSMFTR